MSFLYSLLKLLAIGLDTCVAFVREFWSRATEEPGSPEALARDEIVIAKRALAQHPGREFPDAQRLILEAEHMLRIGYPRIAKFRAMMAAHIIDCEVRFPKPKALTMHPQQ